MKKLVFTFLTMVVFAFVANTTFAQTSTTPYVGATYNYTVSGLDGADVARTVRIYFTTDAAPSTLLTPGTSSSITISNVTNGTVGSVSGDYHVLTLDNEATSISFDATYGADLATSTDYRVWIEIFDTDEFSCSNMMYLDVTTVENTLDFEILAAVDEQCPATTVPTTQQTDAVDDVTEIIYTITRIDGTSTYDWAFNLAILPTTFGPASEAVTVAYTVGSGGTLNGGDVFGSEIRVSGVETVTATITIANNPGTDDTDFVATISDMKQYFQATTVVNSTNNDDTDNDEATTTLKRIPSIGNFVGN